MFYIFVGVLYGSSSFGGSFPRQTLSLAKWSCVGCLAQTLCFGKTEVLLWPSPAGGTPSSANQVSSTVKTRSQRCSYPVEVLEVELLEDGISAFHLVPPHGSQVWQQLLPLLRAQPVGFSCLAPGKGRGAGQHGRGRMKQIPPPKNGLPLDFGVTALWRQQQTGWEGCVCVQT